MYECVPRWYTLDVGSVICSLCEKTDDVTYN